jgi:hypothetical protein
MEINSATRAATHYVVVANLCVLIQTETMLVNPLINIVE